MALHIVVCVKSTPSTVNVGVDAATGLPKTAGVPVAINPYDEYAVEEAVRLKERVPGSTATVLTVGGDAAAEVLREAIARGCDAGVLVTGPEFEGGDSYATSLALSAAIKKLHAEKPVSLVLFGKNTSDVGAGVVGAQTAAWLDWAGATAVKKIEAVDDASATVHRSMEDGTDVIKLTLPACVSTVKELNEPRLPSLKGKMAAKKAVFPKWTAAELGLAPAAVGAAGSGTAVVKASVPPARPAGVKIEGATAAEKAKKLVDILFERKLI
ncbi:MAG: electron transfer flavoprotein subunit beta/FixA family protein [Elusimicrobia bacterium]|nr:electron transfer flavoprotein subunit beta/FixA family protein [Elusimicrobiota bacterium]